MLSAAGTKTYMAFIQIVAHLSREAIAHIYLKMILNPKTVSI
jgi:hypothetical protein